MATAIDAVLDALVSAFTVALPTVSVMDGPPVKPPGDTELVLVAHDATPDADATITLDQEWADLACTSRYERGSIPCCVVAQSGDVDIPGRRARAIQMLASIETALRANRTLGGVAMTSEFVTGEVHQFQNGDGSAVVAQFQITYMAQV
jgi:hypothetical protein